MYTVYITPVDLWILIGAAIFMVCVLWWTGRELRRDRQKAREIDMLESSWDLTEPEDELDNDCGRNG